MYGSLVLRSLGAIIFGIVGWRIAALINEQDPPMEGVLWTIPLILLGVGVGVGVVPWLISGALGKIKQIPVQTLAAAIIGLGIALLFSAILALPLSQLPGMWGDLSPVAVSAVLSYMGISIMLMRSREIMPHLGPASRFTAWQSDGQDGKVILDTNSIIDGRIADVIHTGFVRGALVIPKFVLDELHYIADSPDPLRRVRGRRGLDILTRLQKESEVPVEISDLDFEGVREVDSKLVELAKVLHSPIVTNDVNLNRVASLQGVRILNINELVNALKPVVLPGEEMRLRVVQEGKEQGQGVGFLDDGTMVVVEGGKRYIDKEITVTVSRVLQTGAGRMIFAQPGARQ